ncbi:MAG: hypothetical protein U9R12_01635 [Candidatus Caldatribacteriota bacterium]|nr:hypothetical protein [Candidatus Caldatribacteriota bacterium]
MKELLNVKLEILDCFNDSTEEAKILGQIRNNSFNGQTEEVNDKTIIYYTETASEENLKDISVDLIESGIPFKIYENASGDTPPKITIFDGVRIHTVLSDHNGNAYVDMRALRAIIDMLEEDLEIKALFYANEQWVNTDVTSMFRYGMENTKEFATNPQRKQLNDDQTEES